MKKYLMTLGAAGSILLVGMFFFAGSVFSGANDNVTGWAWSGYDDGSGIGWISFNSANPDAGGGADYGVNIDSAGNISGYAWASHIGYISFNDVSGCPSAPCEAKVNTVTGQLSGWARACAVFENGCSGPLENDGNPSTNDNNPQENQKLGGWDGWINLEGVTLDLATGEASGYAWGGREVVGWINFRGAQFGVNVGGLVGKPQCSDGRDNDGDGAIDIDDPFCHTDGNPNNPGSYDPNDNNEDKDACSNGIDDDGDTLRDAADPGCHTDGDVNNPASYNPTDNDETNLFTGECGDGRDNDGDGLIDSADPDCHVDGDLNKPYDPNLRETRECSDARDNDGDGNIDWNGGPNGEPADPDCSGSNDDDEGNSPQEFNSPACSFPSQNGRTIINFYSSVPSNKVKKLRSDKNVSESKTKPVSASIQPGTYTVSLMSWDKYAKRVNISQPKEQWFIKLMNGSTEIARSSAIGDLQDNVQQATRSEIVNTNLNVGSAVNNVIGVHAAFPDKTSANSVLPICAALDKASGGEFGQPPPNINLFTVPNTTRVKYKQSVTLAWEVENADSCLASGGWSGSKATSPGIHTENTGPITSPQTFTLQCSNPNGTTTETINIAVDVTILEFKAAPGRINPGQTAQLTWSTIGASSCTLDDGNGPRLVPTNCSTCGAGQVSPTVTTTYTLTCAFGASSDSATATVNLTKIPTFKEIPPR